MVEQEVDTAVEWAAAEGTGRARQGGCFVSGPRCLFGRVSSRRCGKLVARFACISIVLNDDTFAWAFSS
jgi:hypothetical protein